MQRFGTIENTERFIAYMDQFGLMAIKPVEISNMWKYLLEDDWWYMFEKRAELGPLFERITNLFESSVTDNGTDIFDVTVAVEYSMNQPPGVESLAWGHHLGTTDDGYIFKADPHDHSRTLRFVTGFVRGITMEPLG